MADIKSATGEGSEPQVPDRDQPARDLANLIAQSDADGKGFWRRRRKKSTTTPGPAPTADVKPPADESPKDKSTADTTAADPSADAEANDDTSATDASAAEATTAARPTENAADQPALEESAEQAPTDEPAAKDTSAEKPGAEKAAAQAEAAELSRPTVGVVYEPDESPDGFPAEYGDIIVGLPKKSGTTTTPAEATPADSSEASSNDKDAQPVSVDDQIPSEQPDATFDAAAGQPTAETSSDQPEADQADAASDQAVGTPDQPDSTIERPKKTRAASATAAAQPADDESADSGAENAPDQPEPAEQADAAQSDQPEPSEPSDGADSAGEQSDSAEPGGARSADADAENSPEQPEVAEHADAAQSDQSGPSGDGDPAGEQPADAGAEHSAERPGAAEQPGAPDQADDVEPDGEQAAASGPEASTSRSEHAEVAASNQSDADAKADAASTEQSEPSGQSDGADPAAEQSADAGAENAADQPEVTEQSDASGEADDASPGGEESADPGAAASAGGCEQVGASEWDPSDADTESDAASSESSEASQQSDGAGPAGEQSGGADPVGEQSGGAGRADEQTGDAADEQSDGVDVVDESGGAGAADDPAEELTAEQMAEQVAAEQAAMALITALMRLRGALAASQLPIDVVGADEARQQQKAMLDQLDDYILPRLVQLEAPVLAVVGGSTGAGKSTLVNTIIGKVVSEPGVLRPTTRSPVLIHHPADADWFVGDRVLPGMARSSGDRPGGMEDPGQLRLVAADTVPQGLAILDAPDIDSVVEANRDLATQLLAAADLWLFVTTAARYADAVPWDFLQSASDRSTAVAVVLDRSPEDTIDDITGHLAQMLLERGLGDSPLFSIKETVVDGNGMLPAEAVASIKDWLIDLAADAEARSAVVRRTLHGAVTAMVKKTPPFAAAVKAQAETVIELRSTAETAYDRAVKDIAKATQDGTLLRGEVLARWQEFVGTGELLKGLQTNVGRLRDKMKATVVGKPPPTRDLNDAVESGLESLLREHAEAAAERAEESWQSTAPGRQLLAAGDRDLGRMSKDFPAAAGRAVRDWQGYVLDLVRKEGADKRSTARMLAYGVNGLGLSLMVVIFASTAGITGAEVGIGAGTAVVGQKLLEAVFGDQAVRTLVTKAREDLDGRVHALMDAEFARYLAVLDQHPVDPEAARQLTEAARAVEDCT